MKGLVMFAYAVFIVGTILSLATTGRWFTSGDISIIDTITAMSGATIQALSGIPVVGPTVQFFDGLFNIITWNYPFLDNAWGFVFKGIFLYPVSAGVIFGMVELFQTVAQGVAGLVRNLWPGS